MNQRKLIKELSLNSDGKIIDHSIGLLDVDTQTGRDELKRLQSWEALDVKAGDIYVQIIYRRNKKKKK